MKILAIGDFQGVFPQKLKNKIAKEQFDIIIGVGDYSGINDWRPYLKKMFKIVEKTGEIISAKDYFGKKKYSALLKKDYAAGKAVLSEINALQKPTFYIFGNTDSDWYTYPFDRKIINANKRNRNFIKKLGNMKEMTYTNQTFKEFVFSGFGGYQDPERYVEEDKQKGLMERAGRRQKRISLARKRLFSNLKKIKKNKNKIIVFHYPPKGIFDIIKDKGNPFDGKSAGIAFFGEAIKKYRPRIALCGHMHEYQGMKKLHGVPVINPGDAEKGKAAIITLPENPREKIKVKFIK